MAIDIIMPQMGESISEGTLNKWLKAVGDQVELDEPLFEVSTDKVDTEIPAPGGGVLLEILVPAGQTVEVNTVVARIGAEGEEPQGAASIVTPAAAPSPSAAPSAAPVAPPPTAPSVSAPAPRGRRRASPLVRRIAREHGITDLESIPGRGLDGRVTRDDILSWIERGLHRLPATGGRVPGVWPDGLDLAPYYPTPDASDVVRDMNNVRQRTVKHMMASRRISAHVTSFMECDMGLCAELRQNHRERFRAEHGVDLSYTVFFLKATVDALREWPVLNSSVSADRQSIIEHPVINLGIAVALDWGLIVPVIHDAGARSVPELAHALGDLATRARSKKLVPHEIEGGTFTITNPGVFGSVWGTPIINQPQVGILGVGAIRKRAVVATDPEGHDEIVVRPMTILSMSFDHRVIDGAVADQFVARAVQTLEHFDADWL